MSVFTIADLFPAMPELALALMALVLLIVGVFKGNDFISSQIRISVIALVLAFVLLAVSSKASLNETFSGMFYNDYFTIICKMLLLLGAGISLFLSMGFYRDQRSDAVFEYPVIVLFSLVGMMVMISANGLLSLYMGLEMQSLCLYVLASLHRREGRSSEAGLKYFVLGSIASGILLYGCSLIYGFSGTVRFQELASLYAQSPEMPLGVLVGFILVLIGFCFKISAVPFHMWTPDVYEGSPTPVTAFFAVAPKVAAIALLIRFVMQPFGDVLEQWQQILILVSAASMFVGALGALKQTNIKRLMAYSSIGHVGYILVGIAAGSPAGIRGVLLYLFIYIIMTLGVFACILLMRHRDELTEEISSLSGLSKSRPGIAFILAVLMFSMAGIPPFAGFFGKFFVFYAAVEAGLIGLAVVGMLTSVIAAFYYIRIIKIMYFDDVGLVLDDRGQPEFRVVALLSAVFNICFFISYTPFLILAENAAYTLF